MKDWLMEHKYYVLAAVFIALGGIYYFYVYDFVESPPNQSISGVDNKLQSPKKDEESKKQTNPSELAKKIMVDVKGQIKQPGVYQSNVGERVIDVINRAGGLTDLADQSQVNFAEHIQDEMVIYIPAKGEEGFSTPGAPGTGGSLAVSSSSTNGNQAKINLNKADENELQNLPGIGPAKAAAIIEYRNSSGPFKVIEDLKNISGIGDKTFEKLKDLIVVH